MKKVNEYNKRKAVAAIRWFLNELAKENGGKKISVHQGKTFCALVPPAELLELLGDSYDTLAFEYNIDNLIDLGSDYKNGIGYICANMGKRAPHTKGFAQATKILLHEFGHHMTSNQVVELYGGHEEIDKFYRCARGNQSRYVMVPTEWVATQWGITWLKDPEHRKIAKKFEKKFFACFE